MTLPFLDKPVSTRATAILWALRLRLEGVMPAAQYAAFAAREQAGAPTDELLADLGKLDPRTATNLVADLAINADGGTA